MQTLLRLIMQSHTLVHGQRLMLSSTSAPRIKLMKGGIYDGDFLCFLVFSVEICVYLPAEVFTKGTKHLLMKPGRGRQCAFMALNSILYGQISPVTSWSSKMVDTILTAADDDMFLDSASQTTYP